MNDLLGRPILINVHSQMQTYVCFIQTARSIANKIWMNQSNINITPKLQQQSEYQAVAQSYNIYSSNLYSIKEGRSGSAPCGRRRWTSSTWTRQTPISQLLPLKDKTIRNLSQFRHTIVNGCRVAGCYLLWHAVSFADTRLVCKVRDVVLV